ncbi:hypothetical protein BV22DRAFT_841177 [Leucogyrophana mollusca]|uniref:Uncharacterized protein n=1 Tax=Leucogyrophana mollusca TaxID=85980 RepID=A0ACB8B2G7_9AGAM|nr:hypothetical protein BV22DRAFT_841177 [Leucogyrophana mollusca]
MRGRTLAPYPRIPEIRRGLLTLAHLGGAEFAGTHAAYLMRLMPSRDGFAYTLSGVLCLLWKVASISVALLISLPLRAIPRVMVLVSTGAHGVPSTAVMLSLHRWSCSPSTGGHAPHPQVIALPTGDHNTPATGGHDPITPGKGIPMGVSGMGPHLRYATSARRRRNFLACVCTYDSAGSGPFGALDIHTDSRILQTSIFNTHSRRVSGISL